jgi:hypothetical protein
MGVVCVSAAFACTDTPKSTPPLPARAEVESSPAASSEETGANAQTETAPGESPGEKADDATEGPKPPPLIPLGVPECDRFVEKFVACLDLHVPVDKQESLMRELNTHRARWRELENMQEGKVAAGLACRGVAQRLKSDLIVDYGCAF